MGLEGGSGEECGTAEGKASVPSEHREGASPRWHCHRLQEANLGRPG